MEQQNKVRIFQDGAELAASAALLVIDIAQRAIASKGRFVISLSGGHTPEKLYELLSKHPFRDKVRWDKTVVFWGDERCVPSDDELSNARMARKLLLDIVGVPESHIYAVPVELPPASAASEYENEVLHFFDGAPPGFDLILLGLGENGHTASLFPGSDAVFDKTRLVREVYVAEQKMFRITMTAELINQAANIAFLVEGEGKAGILKTIFTAPYEPAKYPAQVIQPLNGQLYWFVDKKAAGLLPDLTADLQYLPTK